MYGLVQQTPPATEPITLAQLKAHLRIPSNVTTEDTTALPMFITSARMQLESWTGRNFVSQSWILYLDDWSKWSNYWQWFTAGSNFFPSAGQVPTSWWNKPLQLPISPVQSVTSIQYYDITDTL